MTFAFRHGVLFTFAALALLGAPREASAACTSPGGNAGDITWNGSDSIIWCDGSTWYRLRDAQTAPTPAAGSTGHIQFNNGNAFAADSMLFWDNANKRLGIGTVTPQAGLDLSGAMVVRGDSTGYGYFQIKNGTSPFGANFDRFEIVVQSSDQVTRLGNAHGGTGLPRDLALLAGSSERMRITAGGNVGIGTASPQAKLHVEGGAIIGASRSVSGTAQKICSGNTTPGAGWSDYSGSGIYITVNTSGCGFTSAPIYITSIGGSGGHWSLVGGNAIYSPSASSFLIYVKYTTGPATVTDATTYSWYVNWVAYGN